MFYLIRHGQTDWNAERRLQGQKDIPLNDLGRKQAARNGDRLAALIGDPQRYDFVASPLGRTRETMEIVRHQMGLEPEDYRTDNRLLEISFGDWEGFTFDEIRIDSNDAVEERHVRKWDFLQPNGESYQILCDRVEGWLSQVEKDTVVVCHGGVIRALLHLLEGTSTNEIVKMIVPQDQLWVWDGKRGIWD